MADKRIPWSHLEKYLAIHQGTIVSFLDQLNLEITTKQAIELNLPASFLKLHQVITQILRDNNLLQVQEEQKVDQLQVIVKTVMKLQSSLLTQNTTNQQDIKAVINSMRPEITNTFGKALEQEVAGLLQSLAGMTDIIEANFSQIKEILEAHKEEIKKIVTL